MTCGGPYWMTPPVARREESSIRAGGQPVALGEHVVERLERGLVGAQLLPGERGVGEEVELDERFTLHDSPSSASR